MPYLWCVLRHTCPETTVHARTSTSRHVATLNAFDNSLSRVSPKPLAPGIWRHCGSTTNIRDFVSSQATAAVVPGSHVKFSTARRSGRPPPLPLPPLASSSICQQFSWETTRVTTCAPTRSLMTHAHAVTRSRNIPPTTPTH